MRACRLHLALQEQNARREESDARKRVEKKSIQQAQPFACPPVVEAAPKNSQVDVQRKQVRAEGLRVLGRLSAIIFILACFSCLQKDFVGVFVWSIAFCWFMVGTEVFFIVGIT